MGDDWRNEVIPIPLEPCMVVQGSFGGHHARILLEVGCNTNLISKGFAEKMRGTLNSKMGMVHAVIPHSHAGMHEHTVEGVRDACLKTDTDEYDY